MPTKHFESESHKSTPRIGRLDKTPLLLSPSSGGLHHLGNSSSSPIQPCGQKLLRLPMGSRRLRNASHLVVFAGKKNFSEADVDALINRTAATRGVAVESLAQYRACWSAELCRL